MSEKQKFPFVEAREVALEIVRHIAPGVVPGYCEIAGSVRRGKREVGDVEILYVPGMELRLVPGQMCQTEANAVDLHLAELLATGVLEKRLNENGRETWGPKIKLARHVATGIPVDLFATTEESWWNYLVCRTGPAESNRAIASAARKRGWKWEPYSSGFVALAGGERYAVKSEREVFEFVGLKYLEPGWR